MLPGLRKSLGKVLAVEQNMRQRLVMEQENPIEGKENNP
jgi:hypothetical protein